MGAFPPAWLELGRSHRDEDFPAELWVTLGAELVVPTQLTGFCRNSVWQHCLLSLSLTLEPKDSALLSAALCSCSHYYLA